MRSVTRPLGPVLLAGLVVLSALVEDCSAQPSRLGAGLQVGPLTGFSVKYYWQSPSADHVQPSTGISHWRAEAAVLTGSVNGDIEGVLQTSIIDETALAESPLTLYLGPAVALSRNQDEVSIGVAGMLGIRFFKTRFEVYLELTPRLMLGRDLNAVPDAGVGFRYFR